MLGILLFFTQCEKEADLNAEAFINLKTSEADCNFAEAILYAGAGQNNIDAGTNVGTVTATIEGNILSVVYDVVAPWKVVDYHLWVGKRESEDPKGRFLIPRNAAPGLFPFSGAYTFEIDLDELGFDYGDPVYISAHAVVAEGDLENLEDMLPESVNFSWGIFYRFTPILNSYFQITIDDEESWLKGVYEGWCADSRRAVGTSPRSGTAYSSYDAAFLDPDVTPYAFDKPHNLPLVNWVINYDFVGKEFTEEETYTLGDVQTAIWELLWDAENIVYNPTGGVGSTSDARIAAIQSMATDIDYNPAGLDYMPGCDDDLVLVIVQPNPNRQPVLIKRPVPCGNEETAWAFGEYSYTFIDEGIAKKWGWIFEMTYCEE